MSVWEKLGQCLDIFMVWEVSWPNPEEPWLHQSLWSSPRWPMWSERLERAELVLKKAEEVDISWSWPRQQRISVHLWRFI